MPKCGGCGKFLGVNDCVKCAKCPNKFHRACADPSTSALPLSPWICPGCKIKGPRDDTFHTPVKGKDDLSDKNPKETSLALEIRSLRNELSALRTEFREFREEMSGIKDGLQEYGERMNVIESRVDSFELKLGQVELPRLVQLENTVDTLKQQLHDREQESLLNDIQLSGVIETKGENPMHLFITIATKLGIQIGEHDIVHVKRVGNLLRNRPNSEAEDASRPRIIVVRLARRAMRDNLLNAARVRRDLTSGNLQIVGPSNRIYINERLTKFNRQLFFNARQAANRAGWKYVWTRDGRILARKGEGKPTQHVRTETDLTQIFCN